MFNSFDKNIIFNILEKLDSWSVLDASMINKNSNRLCKNKDVVMRLLDAHYPNAFYTDNPWQQYIALISGVYTFYETTEDTFRVGNFHKFSGTITLTKSYHSNIPEPVYEGQIFSLNGNEIWIHGLPVPKGEKLWILYFDTYDSDDVNIHSFKTKEALANWIVDNTYKIQLDSLVDNFYRYVDDIGSFEYHSMDIPTDDLIHDVNFIEMMRKYEIVQWDTFDISFIDDVCIPFTKDNYYKSIMNSESVNMFEYKDCIYICHVQF